MSDRKHAFAIVAMCAILFLALVLTGCGASDGGQQSPSDSTSDPDIDRHGAPVGVDKQIFETFDANVEVQKINVGGIECVLATRNDLEAFALACPGYSTTTGAP